MRTVAATFALFILVMPAVTVPDSGWAIVAAPPPDITMHRSISVSRYRVTGWTPQTLGAQMPAKFMGTTRWHVLWSFLVVNTNAGPAPAPATRNGCRISSADITLRVRQRLPRWRPAQRPRPDLRSSWSRSFHGLDVHEQGHVRHGRQVASRIRRMFMTTASAGCSQERARLGRRARAIVARGAAADVRYDAQTDHGRTQGAWFAYLGPHHE